MRLISSLFVIALAASAQIRSTVQTFGMVGIASGQAARLNVLNVGGRDQASQCLASLIFINDQGEVLKTNTLSISAGHSALLDLNDSDLGLGVTERRQIRAVVALVPAVVSTQNLASCVLAPTLEIFDRSTGRTSVLMTTTTNIPQTPAVTIQQ